MPVPVAATQHRDGTTRADADELVKPNPAWCCLPLARCLLVYLVLMFTLQLRRDIVLKAYWMLDPLSGLVGLYYVHRDCGNIRTAYLL